MSEVDRSHLVRQYVVAVEDWGRERALVTLDWQADDQWVISWGGNVFDRDGDWIWNRAPATGPHDTITDEDLAQHRARVRYCTSEVFERAQVAIADVRSKVMPESAREHIRALI